MNYKELLGDKYTAELEKSIKAEIGKEFIPKEQYNKKVDELKGETDELKDTKEKMDKLQKDIDEYAKSDKTIEELKEKLETTNAEFETFKADNAKRETNRGKLESLRKAFDGKINKDSVDLISGTYDLEKITIDSKGDVVDFDVMLEDIKTNRPSLIIDENLQNETPQEGEPKDKVDWNKLSDQEYFDMRNKKE